MARPTYRARVIVLRKTKLGESDLILTLLAENGAQLRAVAKGARKPTSTFSSRLELFSVADVLCAKGKTLDVVSEAQLVEGNARLRGDIALAAAAAPVAELLDRVTQLGLENERLFAMTRAALAAMNRADAQSACAICAAHLLKTFAFCGLRPQLGRCAACGAEVPSATEGTLAFSAREGGVICSRCRPHVETSFIEAASAYWASFLLASTFRDIEAAHIGPAASFSALKLCQTWTLEHVGCRLKSLNFLFTCGLF